MSKHEPKGNYIHAPERKRMSRQPPSNQSVKHSNSPVQAPGIGTNDMNQYK
jgi:hypothetical protein